jgi:hypothetical protein
MQLSLFNYINKMLEKFNMINCKPVNTPMDSKIKLEPNNEKATINDIKWYQTAIGSLLYITLAVRVDITYAVIKLSRFTSNPSLIHITSVKRIMRYLKGSASLGINYKRNKNPIDFINGFCDSYYAGDLLNYKSTTGYIFFIAEGPISWKSKLQSIIAQSTTEAEYIAINAAIKEAIYIKAILEELGLYKQNKFPIYTDNNGARLLAQNPTFHERTKHIAVKYHYIRDLINKGIIDLHYVSTNDQKADGLTKALDKIKFNGYLNHLNFKENN